MVPTQAIQSCLESVLASAEFARAKRMSRFLRFVVEETLAGRAEDLKERQIGIAVFDQPADWDPKINNIVRGEARRLRTKLDSYYRAAGESDAIRISIPKGGYSAEFTEVRQAEELPQSEWDDKSAAVSGISAAKWRTPAFAAGVLAAALIFALLYLAPSWHASAKAREDNFEVVPFADEIGQEFSPAVSPDNTRVAYVWDGNGDNYDIYIKEIGKGGITRLTRDAAPDLDPAWSPDGTRVAFLRVLPDRLEVLTESAAGGPERVVTETASPINSWGADSNPYFGCYGPAWSPDGTKIVFSDVGSAGHGFSLYGISLQSGRRMELTHPAGEARDTCPNFSPDGERIAFVRFASHGISDIHVAAGDGSRDRQITSDGRTIRGLNWTSDRQNIVFSSLRMGSFQLHQVGADGGEAQLLPVSSTSAVSPSVAPAGHWMAFTELEDNWNIWRAPLSAAGVGKPELFLSSTGKNHSPSYSPDGKHIAFVSDRSGSPEVWLADGNGGDLRKLTNFGGPWLGSIRWSPDGQNIVFDARPRGHSGIFTMRIAGGEPVPLEEDQFEERRPTWSADGQSIYFNSSRGGTLQIWKRSLKSGELTPIGPANTNASIESADGRSLYFGENDDSLWRSNPDGSAAQQLRVASAPQPGLDWSLTPDGIYFAGDQGERAAFFFYSFASGTTTRIGYPERAFAPGTPSLMVSPDGKWILYAQMDHVSTDIRIRRPSGGPASGEGVRSLDALSRASWNKFLSASETALRDMFGWTTMASDAMQKQQSPR
jgi:Tol biopolymer transport system component